MRRLALLVALSFVYAFPAAAQAVRGVVVEQDTGTPIEGAMVIVLTGENRVAKRVLTGRTGAFEARVTSPGVYHVRIDRIGYQSLTTDPFDVPPDGTFRRIPVPIHAVELTGLDVSGAKRCELRGDVGRATATVWEEARKALEAAAWTLESEQYQYTLLHFTRQLDAGGGTVVQEERAFSRLPGKAPYISRPAEQLADSGFVQRLPGGRLIYFAPDAEVLLSDAFLDTHCMKLQEGKEGLVGLAFEPVKGRKLPEIKGVLWMEARTATLHRMEFRYTNLGRGPASGDAGGEVRFGHLPDGTWIVREWHIRMPILQRSRFGRYVRTAYQEEGGLIWRVIDHAGAVVAEAVTATLHGRFVDSTGAPLPGATVRPQGLGGVGVGDASGRWRLLKVPEGHLKLDVGAAFLDTLGLPARDGPVNVDVAEGDTLTLDDIRVPGVYETLAEACGGQKRPKQTAILFGRVRQGGLPAKGAVVRAAWLRPQFRVAAFRPSDRAAPTGGPGQRPTWAEIEGPGNRLEATLDARGIFMLCDVPTRSAVRLQAELGGRLAETTARVAAGDRVKITTLTIQPEGGR